MAGNCDFNDHIELRISETADAMAKSVEGTEYTSKTTEYSSKEPKDPVFSKIVIESCPEVFADTEDKNESNLVTLRRKKNSFSETVEIADDDYKFFEYIQDLNSGNSRKKIEIGSENMISNNDLLLAATLVHDAMEGRIVDFKAEPKYVKSYNWYKSWPLTYLLYLAIVVDLCLVLFEDPAMQGLAINYSATISVEGFCLVYFTIRICHNYHWRRSEKFFRDYKNIFIIGILTISFIDIVVYIILKQVSPNSQTVRYSRVLRPLVIINFSDGRQIRRAWRNMRRTIKEILHVLILFYFFIFVFALIAYKMFSTRDDMKYPDGKEYFKDYMDSVWDLYVLVTTANNPDVLIPAVEKSKFYCIFFFIYILVCFYMLLNVFLAVAYNSYNENLKKEIKRSACDKKRKLEQAFDVIKINRNGEDIVTYRIWKRLMTLAQPKLSKNQIDLLMLILDMNRSGYIGKREFMNVADLLNVPVSEVEDRITYIEKWFPNMYNSIPAEYLKAFVDSFIFKILYDVIVIIEVFVIGFEVQHTDIVFCTMFIFEITIKIFTYGPLKYFKQFGNWFDIVITTASVVAITTFHIQDPDLSSTLTIVKIMRIFRLFRLLEHMKRFKIIIDTLINISLSILLYCGILFIIFYMFAIIGMEVFKDKITSDTQNITNGTSREGTKSQQKRKITRLQDVLNGLKIKCAKQEKQYRDENAQLQEDYKRITEQFRDLQKKSRHFMQADTNKFSDVWCMNEQELKDSVFNVLDADRVIHTQQIGLEWIQPDLEFMDNEGPLMEDSAKKSGVTAQQVVQEVLSATGGRQTATSHQEDDQSETDSNIPADRKPKKTSILDKISAQTIKQILELLCDESGFLVESKLNKLLAPLEKDEQSLMKLDAIFSALHIDTEEDIHLLASYFMQLKGKPEQEGEGEKKEDEESKTAYTESGDMDDIDAEILKLTGKEGDAESSKSETVELIHPNEVLKALRSFVDDNRKPQREKGKTSQFKIKSLEERDDSGDSEYWAKYAQVISTKKERLWDALLEGLEKYSECLNERSGLITETDALRQQNAELRMLLHQYVNSKVNAELEVPPTRVLQLEMNPPR